MLNTAVMIFYLFKVTDFTRCPTTALFTAIRISIYLTGLIHSLHKGGDRN